MHNFIFSIKIYTVYDIDLKIYCGNAGVLSDCRTSDMQVYGKGREMKHSIVYYVIMAVAFLVILRAPFMPYVHSELLASYLDYDFLTATGLVEEMHVLNTMPGSVSFFGYEHYDLITKLLMALGVVMILLPILLEAVGLALLLKGKTEKQKKAGMILPAAVVVLFAFYLFFFSIAGVFVGMPTRPGYGIYAALAASIAVMAAVILYSRESGRFLS